MADDPKEPARPPDKPPLLEYPSRPIAPEPDSESWSEIVRATLIVFAFLGFLLFISFGFCGILGRGCG